MNQFKFPANTPMTQRISEALPSWASRKIEAWDDETFQQLSPFIVEKYWSSQESINVFNVVGTKHPSYTGLTWVEFLQHGIRMQENLRSQELNPGYYLDTAVKQPTMLYVSLDNDELYVNGDGNHRTAIARFMFHEKSLTMLHGVTVERYRSDREAYKLYREIVKTSLERRCQLDIRPVNRAISRDDTGGWMRERYQLELVVSEVSSGKKLVLTRDQFAPYLEKLRQGTGLLRYLTGFLKPWQS